MNRLEEWYYSQSNKTQYRIWCFTLICAYLPIKFHYWKNRKEHRTLAEALHISKLEFEEKAKTNTKLHRALK